MLFLRYPSIVADSIGIVVVVCVVVVGMVVVDVLIIVAVVVVIVVHTSIVDLMGFSHIVANHETVTCSAVESTTNTMALNACTLLLL